MEKAISLTRMIIKECKAIFGESSNWEFEYVDELPKLRSGKVQMTVCRIPDKCVL